jgi:hypothetical protein
VHFVPVKARGNALSFPPDFDVAAVFPYISVSNLDGPGVPSPSQLTG